MPQGDKLSYIDRQKRQVSHIEAGYEKKRVGTKTTEERAWATSTNSPGGGKKAGPEETGINL